MQWPLTLSLGFRKVWLAMLHWRLRWMDWAWLRNKPNWFSPSGRCVVCCPPGRPPAPSICQSIGICQYYLVLFIIWYWYLLQARKPRSKASPKLPTWRVELFFSRLASCLCQFLFTTDPFAQLWASAGGANQQKVSNPSRCSCNNFSRSS